MTALDQNTPLPADEREALIKQHEYDELIFGGFVCMVCTPNWETGDDPDDNVYYPCPPLRAAGVTNEEAVLIIKLARAERERDWAKESAKYNAKRASDPTSERDKALEAAKHMGAALEKAGTVMQIAVATSLEFGNAAAMDVIISYLSDAGLLPSPPSDGEIHARFEAAHAVSQPVPDGGETP